MLGISRTSNISSRKFASRCHFLISFLSYLGLAERFVTSEVLVYYTLYFENNLYIGITSFFYSAWIPYVPRPTQEQSVGAPARQAERRLLIRDRRVRMLVAERRLAGAPRNGVLQYGKHEEANESFMFENA